MNRKKLKNLNEKPNLDQHVEQMKTESYYTHFYMDLLCSSLETEFKALH